MVEQITDKKDEILGKLVCIMANAPMITERDIDQISEESEPSNAATIRSQA
jgi:hypothetical protein